MTCGENARSGALCDALCDATPAASAACVSGRVAAATTLVMSMARRGIRMVASVAWVTGAAVLSGDAEPGRAPLSNGGDRGSEEGAGQPRTEVQKATLWSVRKPLPDTEQAAGMPFPAGSVSQARSSSHCGLPALYESQTGSAEFCGRP